MKIAVTGGMGCGKSTVINALSDLLPDYKFASYDTEVIRMYGRDWQFRDALRSHFGTDIKAAVARIVFEDREKMNLLIRLTDEKLHAFTKKVVSNSDVVMEFPMLFETPWAPAMFDMKIAVWCDRDMQIARIKARDKLTDEQIAKKLAYHLSTDEKAARADFVIDTTEGAVDVHVQLEAALRVAQLNLA